jgi:hypothetical protein
VVKENGTNAKTRKHEREVSARTVSISFAIRT